MASGFLPPSSPSCRRQKAKFAKIFEPRRRSPAGLSSLLVGLKRKKGEER
jgi:hypothetical protein